MPSYFKVVTKDLKSFISCMDESRRISKYVIQYDLNKIIYPAVDNSKLFVFENFNNALKFKQLNESQCTPLDIYVCHVINPEICLSIGCRCGIIDYDAIDLYWNPTEAGIYHYLYTKTPPTGTIQCEAVQLLAKVEC